MFRIIQLDTKTGEVEAYQDLEDVQFFHSRSLKKIKTSLNSRNFLVGNNIWLYDTFEDFPKLIKELQFRLAHVFKDNRCKNLKLDFGTSFKETEISSFSGGL